METIISIVGFLGAGKTTLLKHLIKSSIREGWNPFVVLNDYENAHLDVLQLTQEGNQEWIKALSGSCICCSGIHQLRDYVNAIPERDHGITLVEANGTSDACSLMGFLGVGVNERYLPPVQISVVDVKNWQKRGEHNALEANQVQLSSLMILSHLEFVSQERKIEVIEELKKLNPFAKIITMEEVTVSLLSELIPSTNKAEAFDHKKAHWSSCSCDLPTLPKIECIDYICETLPESILRVKGCTKIGSEDIYTFFERNPDGEISIRPLNGMPVTGPKLLAVGPNSNLQLIEEVIGSSLEVFDF